jgi:hypothetical protein
MGLIEVTSPVAEMVSINLAERHDARQELTIFQLFRIAGEYSRAI